MSNTAITRQQLEALILELFETVPGNTVSEAVALDPACVGVRMFDAPIVKIGAADDPLFDDFKKEEIVGPWHRTPKEWLPTAKSVIALYFPISAEVRETNLRQTDEASNEWRHARHDGQLFQNAFTAALTEALAARGYASVVPATDPAFFGVNEGKEVNVGVICKISVCKL